MNTILEIGEWCGDVNVMKLRILHEYTHVDSSDKYAVLIKKVCSVN